MSDKSLSDRERALLQAARREVAAKVKRREVEAARPTGSAPHHSSRSAPPSRGEPRAVSPLDAPTVIGWDHPAAQAPPGAGEDKWSRIADLLEAERAEAAEKRAKTRRGVIIFLSCLFFIMLIVGARVLVR
jgi:hypothetical protein